MKIRDIENIILGMAEIVSQKDIMKKNVND